jgi:hypothetical protein
MAEIGTHTGKKCSHVKPRPMRQKARRPPSMNQVSKEGNGPARGRLVYVVVFIKEKTLAGHPAAALPLHPHDPRLRLSSHTPPAVLKCIRPPITPLTGCGTRTLQDLLRTLRILTKPRNKKTAHKPNVSIVSRSPRVHEDPDRGFPVRITSTKKHHN